MREPSDLGELLRAHADSASTITIDEVRAIPIVRAPRRRTPLVLAVAATLLVLAAFAGLVVTGDDDSTRVATEATTTSTRPVVEGLDLPDGWKVLDLGDVRFAVPAAWPTTQPQLCGGGDADGAVYVGTNPSGEALCVGSDRTVLQLQPVDAALAPNARRVPDQVGGLAATRVEQEGCRGFLPNSAEVPTCRAYEVGGLLVTAYGPQADRVLSTFTESGRVRARKAGPVADTTGWQRVTHWGVSLLVPPAWRVEDLANGTSTPGAPLACGGTYFVASDPTVFVGSGNAPSCPGSPSGPSAPPVPVHIEPADGLWFASVIADASIGGAVAPAASGVTVAPAVTNLTDLRPTLELAVRGPGGDGASIVVGVGPDVSIARAMIRSIGIDGPGGTRAAVDAWPTPFGSEVAAPAVPDGWKLVETGDVRFAVPEEWPTSDGLAPCQGQLEGIVLLQGTGYSGCTAPPTLPSTIVAILHGEGSASGVPERVGTFDATRIDVPPVCTIPFGQDGIRLETCNVRRRLSTGTVVVAVGPAADRVLATFTDSGRRRALQGGPVADTAGWRTVGFDGVVLQVPAEWPVTDNRVPGSYAEPGFCFSPMFQQPALVLSANNLSHSCPMASSVGGTTTDGTWLRSAGDQGLADVPVLASADAKGVRIDVLDFAAGGNDLRPRLDLRLTTGGKVSWLTLGVGADPSIARAIIRSIAAA